MTYNSKYENKKSNFGVFPAQSEVSQFNQNKINTSTYIKTLIRDTTAIKQSEPFRARNDTYLSQQEPYHLQSEPYRSLNEV